MRLDLQLLETIEIMSQEAKNRLKIRDPWGHFQADRPEVNYVSDIP